MKYHEIAFYADERTLNDNLELINSRKSECLNNYELRKKHILWMQENPISLENVIRLKREEWQIGYNFYGYGIRFQELLEALNLWEDFYSPLDEIDDLNRLEDALKYRNAKDLIDELNKKSDYIPTWIKPLVDVGLVDTDGKTVLAENLETVAAAIRDTPNQVLVITQHHLKRFIKASDGKSYSESAIKKALNLINTK